MRKVIRPLSQQFQEVTLYLDDIERIVSCLEEISPVQIRTDEYVLDTLAGLKELPREYITSLFLICREHYVYVDIDGRNVRLYVGSDDPKARLAFERIRDILIKREGARDRILESPSVIGAVSGAALSTCLLGSFIAGNGLLDWTIAGGAFAVFLALLVWDRLTIRRIRARTSRVWLTHQKGGDTFWLRNSERVLIALIASAITMAIMFIINAFLRL